ncbi:MAG TPA: cupin domain-containing protein [Vicinamibacterales bacterium]|jgi:hypothetical protein
MIRPAVFLVSLLTIAMPGSALAQTPAAPNPPGQTGRGSTKPAAKPAAAKTTSVRVTVKDPGGQPLEDVHLVLSGAAEGDYSTGGAGTAVLTNIKDGLYRLHCEHQGFVTLEREFPVKAAGALTPVDITMTPAPPPPPPPPPPPAPVVPTAANAGPPVNVNIPDFLDHNFIGREPLKESILACKPGETVRLLQLRESMAEHTHDKDEIVYIVAGEGALHVADQTMALKAGSLAVVPQSMKHAIERRGKNPLILVSTLSGAPCTPSTHTAQ